MRTKSLARCTQPPGCHRPTDATHQQPINARAILYLGQNFELLRYCCMLPPAGIRLSCCLLHFYEYCTSYVILHLPVVVHHRFICFFLLILHTTGIGANPSLDCHLVSSSTIDTMLPLRRRVHHHDHQSTGMRLLPTTTRAEAMITIMSLLLFTLLPIATEAFATGTTTTTTTRYCGVYSYHHASNADNAAANAPGSSSSRPRPRPRPRPTSSTALFMISRSQRSETDRNFYAILQVNRKANDAEIKLAYRRLAKLYHPDSNLNEDTTVQFQELNRAYEVLSDPSLKKMYDMFGESGLGTSAASDIEVARRRSSGAGFGVTIGRTSPNGGVGGSSRSMDPEIYDTYFSAKSHRRAAGSGTTNVGSAEGYGSRTGGIHQFVGDDVCIDFEVDFKTSILGGEAEVYVRSLETCDTCNGKGHNIGDDTAGDVDFICDYCDGTGMTTKVTQTPLGKFESNQDCQACGGTGNAPGSDCLPCDGKGATEKNKAIKVTIPAGVDSGSKLQVCGEGDAGPRGGPAGDLYIFLRIKEDPLFRREGLDIYAEQTISCLDAMLGNTIRVPVVDGETTIDIPAGTQPGHTICLKGSGAPSLIGNLGKRGDHYVVINVEIPKGVSDDAISLVSMLKDQAALLADPTVAAGGSDSVDEIQEQEAKKIEVDFSQLEDLRTKAAEAKTERSLRKDFEELAAARKTEIDDLTRRLADLRATLREETQEKEEAQELATLRETKLKALARRLDDLRSYLDD